MYHSMCYGVDIIYVYKKKRSFIRLSAGVIDDNSFVTTSTDVCLAIVVVQICHARENDQGFRRQHGINTFPCYVGSMRR